MGIYVDYSRSPEAKYPVAINEANAATKWVAENGVQINVDGKRLAVVGNIAAATVLMAKDKNGPVLTLQVLFWPRGQPFSNLGCPLSVATVNM